MGLFGFKLQPFVLLLTLSACIAAFGQGATGNTDWETLRPEGEEFTVTMPKGSTFEASKEAYHKMELNTRTYLSNSKPGPVYAVVSLSGIKSNPAQYTEMQRMNSYVDAFKTLFAPKIRKDAIAKLTLVGDKNLYGNVGREYRLTIGDLSGTAHAFATRKRFYSIVYLNTKKDDDIQERFLSSFVLPENIPEVAATTKPQPKGVASESPASTGTSEAAPAKRAENEESKPEEPLHAVTDPAKRAPISAGVLNGKALTPLKPDYPADAKAAGAEGVVVVQVTIDEQGNVIEARAISGPKMLMEVSVNAARQAKFLPTLLQGEAVKVTGVIIFNFGRPMS